MAELTLKIIAENGETILQATGTEHVALVSERVYEEGDQIILTSSKKNCFLVLQLDDAMRPAHIYLTGDTLMFTVPFHEKKVAYSPKSFSGERHLLTARMATESEICVRKNLAENVYDQHGDTSCYPHAVANVETRGESVFAARNAIDGNTENRSHGEWPYESWGINQQADAEIKVLFGRPVEIDGMVLYTRADFPHDNYWIKATFTFSDGTSFISDLIKTQGPQKISFDKKKVEWVRLSNLIKSQDPSPFPALSQWEIYGTEAK